MKYESSILKRLIDTYGVVGNPRYLSEIIKEFIVRGKELYPQLFTYQSDWLAHIDEFGLTPEYTVSYTGHHIYAPNTKEKPVKRAILTGQTLVNLFEEVRRETRVNEAYRFFKVIGNQVPTLKPNTKYTLIFDKYVEGVSTVIHKNHSASLMTDYYTFGKSFCFSTIEDVGTEFHIFIKGETLEIAEQMLKLNPKIVILEGDYTNIDIPYFEGMQSVRMPVLTTSNEDGTKTNILTVNEDVTLRSNGSVCDELDLLTGKLTQRIDEDGEVLAKEVIKTVDLTIKDQNDVEVSQLSSFNGGTHFTTSSQDGSLLPTLTVDVVTDLEETLAVCSLEGNTM